MKMRIDRNNYEEFFILYMDNELSPADRLMVESFVSNHPDLEEELLLLMETKLSPDTEIVFENKSELIKEEGFSYPGMEEDLLLYADNELSAEKKKELEDLAQKHEPIRTSIELLLKTKAEPEMDIVFPDKKSLYRYEEKEKVITIRWWRIAAAAILILAIGGATYSILNNNNSKPTDAVAGTQNSGVDNGNKTTPSNNKESVTAGKENPEPDGQLASSNKETKEEATTNSQKSNRVINQKKNTIEQSPLQEDLIAMAERTTNSEYALPVTRIENTPANVLPIDAGTKTMNPQGIVKGNYPPTSSVTKGEPVALHQSEASNKKFRGVFRKATRILEKTTNMPVASEEDRLLIGGLAVKLK